MKEKLTQLLQEGKDRIDAARSESELQEVKGLLLGKQGKLTELLKEKGYPIARRTVAKYRQQMNIPVARLRR